MFQRYFYLAVAVILTIAWGSTAAADDFYKGKTVRIEVGIHGDSDIVRTYTLPPGTPKDRVQIPRKAFDATLKDVEFLADAKKSSLTVDPVAVDEVEKDIAGLFKLDPSLLAKLKDILYN